MPLSVGLLVPLLSIWNPEASSLLQTVISLSCNFSVTSLWEITESSKMSSEWICQFFKAYLSLPSVSFKYKAFGHLGFLFLSCNCSNYHCQDWPQLKNQEPGFACCSLRRAVILVCSAHRLPACETPHEQALLALGSESSPTHQAGFWLMGSRGQAAVMAEARLQAQGIRDKWIYLFKSQTFRLWGSAITWGCDESLSSYADLLVAYLVLFVHMCLFLELVSCFTSLSDLFVHIFQWSTETYCIHHDRVRESIVIFMQCIGDPKVNYSGSHSWGTPGKLWWSNLLMQA